jgi:hypothetical protein
MRKLAMFALCFLSSIATAGEIEEVVVKARQVKIVLNKLSLHHKQNPFTGNWYYVESKQTEEKRDGKEGE